jgi:hypothetical protein
MGVSINEFQKLSTALKESLNNIALYISAVVVLQNSRALVLLTGDKSGLCLFLREDCFFANKSGIARDRVKKLRDKEQQLTPSQPTNILSSLYPWLISLAVPLILV